MKLLSTTHGVPAEAGRESEDAFRVQQRGSRAIAVLADGLGSSREGGVAARRAVDMMVDYHRARPLAWSIPRSLHEFATQINRLFHQESLQRHGSPELLCTLSVVVIEGGRLYGLNVGDSPVYLQRGGSLSRLSQAHHVDDPNMRHVLTRAIGLEASVEPFLFEAEVLDHDQILLCSDGVSNPLSDDTLSRMLEGQSTARAIVAAAREVVVTTPELQDDASAIVLRVVERGWAGDHPDRTLEVVPVLRLGQSVDDYVLVRPLQEGGRVWLAENSAGLRHVLKFPPSEAHDDEIRRDAFIREVWQATRVNSPDFVRAFIPPQESLRYYAMDFVDAPTLRKCLQKGPLRVEEAVELGRFLLRACQFLLTRDLAHADLKPDNILVVNSSGRLRFLLLDFGSAAELFSVTSRAGTPSYLAPERFMGGALSERTEIFAIGVTLYETLSQVYPYGEIERFQTPRFDSTPPLLSRRNPAVPGWLESLVRRALSPDPEHRYQNFSEMAYDLGHPDQVAPYHRKDAPLLERNPLLFYRVSTFILLMINMLLALLLLRK